METMRSSRRAATLSVVSTLVSMAVAPAIMTASMSLVVLTPEVAPTRKGACWSTVSAMWDFQSLMASLCSGRCK
ncbi:MAG: hypothetical protein EKK55_15025 [Rhodocyclaceae bacterium]|nr:MAG: hypothetical protein EKK55_15025 [Rhodocyclaceae bacterium]